MKGKKTIVFLFAIWILCSTVSFAQTHRLTRIGVNTFAQVKGNIPTAEVMKMLADKYAGDITAGFDLVGMGAISPLFLDQLKSANFTAKSIPVGDKFYWMLFRVKGKVTVWQDVEWAGQKPLDVFSFTVNQDTKFYEFVIPRPCGNIALYKTWETPKKVIIPPAVCDLRVSPAKANANEPIVVDMSGSQNAVSMDVEVFTAQGTRITSHAFTPTAARWQTRLDKPGEYVFRGRAVNEEGKISENTCQARILINFPPVCKLFTSCLPCQDYVGRPIVFDASGSTDPDGQVVKASYELLDSSGTVVDSYMKTDKPLIWEKVITKAGTYTMNVVVFDDMGAPSSNADPCKVTFEVTQKRFFFLIEVGGLLAKGTYTGYLFGRLGLMWNLVPNAVDLIVRFGGALPLHGDPWKAFFMADALANFHLGPAVYIDLGLGYTGREQNVRKSGVDLIGDFGVNLFNNYSSAGSIFAEVRAPVITKNRSFDEHHKLALGFRFIF